MVVALDADCAGGGDGGDDGDVVAAVDDDDDVDCDGGDGRGG